ncbi:MAG: hypothetical protein JO026_03020 [Patescibacteria group bacterium]|nr:hypothetical protein [Patescibacteria group bacterium]
MHPSENPQLETLQHLYEGLDSLFAPKAKPGHASASLERNRLRELRRSSATDNIGEKVFFVPNAHGFLRRRPHGGVKLVAAYVQAAA